MVDLKPISYLAAPYSLDGVSSEYDRMQRYGMVTRAAWELFSMGINVYSPITHHHTIQRYGRIQMPSKEWMKYDLAFLEVSEKLYVLMIDFWDLSRGVQLEIKYATDNEIPIVFLEPSEFVLGD
jgi:hypothetical protein